MMVLFLKHINTFIVTWIQILWKDTCLMLGADGLNLAQTCLTLCAVRK